jgi:hypothetical protein
LPPRGAGMRELEAERLQEYQAKYGYLADQPITQWDPDFPTRI